MWITRVSINNPVFATMVMIGIAVLGLFAYNRLRVEQMPDVSLPFVLVLTNYPGASPEVVESDVTKPLEYAINTVSGASLIRSNSKEGRSEVFAEFRMSTDMIEGDAGRPRQDRAGSPQLSARRQGSARPAHRAGERAAGGVARRALADDEPARPLVAHRPDDRQGARERPRGGQDRRQRPRDAADPGPDQAQCRDFARHRRRPGDQRDPRGEPGRPGRTHHARPDGLDRPRRGQDQGSGAVRPDHRRPAGRRAGLPVAGRGRHRRREGRGIDLAHQRPAVDHDRHPEVAGREHRRHRSRHHRGDRAPEDAPAPRRRAQDGQFDGRCGRARRQPREVDDRRGRAADGPHRLPVPAQLAQHDHHGPHAADRRDRDLHRAVRVRLHAQLPHADGAVAVHRPPDRRRDRRAREHRAPPGARQEPRRCGARGHGRDRARGDGDDVRHRRGVRADRVHERHHRPLLLPVRRHRRRRRAGLAVRLLHARPDALRGLARSARVALQARALARPLHGQGRARNRTAACALRRDPRVGARPPQVRSGARPRHVPRELRDRAAGRHRVRPAGRRRASSRCGSTRRSARASSTPTARCGRSKPRSSPSRRSCSR